MGKVKFSRVCVFYSSRLFPRSLALDPSLEGGGGTPVSCSLPGLYVQVLSWCTPVLTGDVPKYMLEIPQFRLRVPTSLWYLKTGHGYSPLRQNRASTLYAGGGIPFVVTHEDFLLRIFNLCYICSSCNSPWNLHTPFWAVLWVRL